MHRFMLAVWVAAVVLVLGLPTHRALADEPPPPSIWDVIVGGDNADPTITTYSYWPSVLTIHTGDTIRWSFFSNVEQHTVSFMRGDPYPAVYAPGPGSGEYALGAAWYPMGTIAANATFDDTEDLSSGAVFGNNRPVYSLTFTVPGTFTYVCLLHPGMSGVVSVVDPAVTLKETPSQALMRGESELQGRLTALRNRVDAQWPAGADTSTAGAAASATGPAVHTVSVGLSDLNGASALRYLPGDITVHRGDQVRWTVTDAYAHHSVTFTSGGPVPDVLDVRRSGPPLLVLPADVVGPAGGNRYDGQSYVNSGFLTAATTFALTIDAPAGTYTYVCLLHPDVMRGSITVVDDGHDGQ